MERASSFAVLLLATFLVTPTIGYASEENADSSDDVVEGDFLVSDTAGIPVLQNVVIELSVDSRSGLHNCRYKRPQDILGSIVIVDPDRNRSAATTILARELFGSGMHCRGQNTLSKEINPLGTAKGLYKVEFNGIAVNIGHPLGGSIVTVTPSVKMWVDGRRVVDVSFPTEEQSSNVRNTWKLDYR